MSLCQALGTITPDPALIALRKRFRYNGQLRYGRLKSRRSDVSGTSPNQAGIALVLVLWVVTLLSTMALTLVATQRTETALTQNLMSAGQGRSLAEAGVYYAIARGLLYRASTKSEKWEPDGSPHTWEFAGSQLKVIITSEHGYIDLNHAKAKLLDSLLATSGMDEAEIPALRDAILDWRDKNDEHLLHGAEDSDYLAAGREYGAKDTLYNSVSELRQVLGMTPEIYQVVAPALTVYSGKEKVDATFAPPQVLSALPGMDEDRLGEYLELRTSHRERGLSPPEPTVVERDVVGRGGGRINRVYVEVLGGENRITRLQAIVRKGGGAEGYEILAWNFNPDRVLPVTATEAPE